MSVAPAKQGLQIRIASVGPQLLSGPSVIPTVSGTLWTVANGAISITGVFALVTTAFTATVTTMSAGATLSGGASATALFNATAVTSAGVGTWLTGAPTPSSPVVAVPGNITWIASAGNTGQVKLYLNYIPLSFDATVG